jgi:molybdopterin adenylyltransferase
MSHTEHRATAPAVVQCSILTVSDTRTESTDTSGRAICDLLEGVGHRVTCRSIVPDDPETVREAIIELLVRPDVQVVITTGGTGITSRDSTYEIVTRLLDKRLDGFGELFRMISYQQIGSAAMLSRAVGGLARGKVVLSLPGSEAAVRLAMTTLILPELGHLVREATR